MGSSCPAKLRKSIVWTLERQVSTSSERYLFTHQDVFPRHMRVYDLQLGGIPLNAHVELVSPRTCEHDLVWKWGVCRGQALVWHDCVLTEKRCFYLETQLREETAHRHPRCGTRRAGTGGVPQASEQRRAEGADRGPPRQHADGTLASELGQNRSHRV